MLLMLVWNELGETVEHECGRKGLTEGAWIGSLGDAGERYNMDVDVKTPSERGLRDVDAWLE